MENAQFHVDRACSDPKVLAFKKECPGVIPYLEMALNLCHDTAYPVENVTYTITMTIWGKFAINEFS